MPTSLQDPPRESAQSQPAATAVAALFVCKVRRAQVPQTRVDAHWTDEMEDALPPRVRRPGNALNPDCLRRTGRFAAAQLEMQGTIALRECGIAGEGSPARSVIVRCVAPNPDDSRDLFTISEAEGIQPACRLLDQHMLRSLHEASCFSFTAADYHTPTAVYYAIRDYMVRHNLAIPVTTPLTLPSGSGGYCYPMLPGEDAFLVPSITYGAAVNAMQNYRSSGAIAEYRVNPVAILDTTPLAFTDQLASGLNQFPIRFPRWPRTSSRARRAAWVDGYTRLIGAYKNTALHWASVFDDSGHATACLRARAVTSRCDEMASEVRRVLRIRVL